MRTLLIMWLATLIVTPAIAENLVGGSSNNRISIASNFDGEIITLFGAIEPSEGQETSDTAATNIVVRVVGPDANIVARKKTSRYGVWLNREKAFFQDVPGFLAINSSAPLSHFATPEVIAALGLDFRANLIGHENFSQASSIGDFRDALVRIRREQGLYSNDEAGVTFLSKRLYAAKVRLPANAASGSYYADTFLFRNSQLVSQRRDIFTVNKTGFERFLSVSARDNGLLYGLACVFLALFVGWFGGLIFRR